MEIPLLHSEISAHELKGFPDLPELPPLFPNPVQHYLSPPRRFQAVVHRDLAQNTSAQATVQFSHQG